MEAGINSLTGQKTILFTLLATYSVINKEKQLKGKGMDTLTLLKEAINNKQVLRVVYWRGSRPGQERDIGPIKIADNKVHAKCYRSNRVKPFFIEHLQVITSDGEITNMEAAAYINTQPEFENPRQLFDAIESHFPEEKWQVKKGEDELSIWVYGRFKNGNIRKTPELSIYYEDEGVNVIYMGGEVNVETEIFKKSKPWTVSCKQRPSISYKYFNKAAQRFLNWSAELLSVEKLELDKR